MPNNHNSPPLDTTTPDTTLTVRVNRHLKSAAQSTFRDLGLDLSTAVNIFLRQVVHSRSLPFPISLSPVNPPTPANSTPVDPSATTPTSAAPVQTPTAPTPVQTPTPADISSPHISAPEPKSNSYPSPPDSYAPSSDSPDSYASSSTPYSPSEPSGAARLLDDSDHAPLGEPFSINRRH